MSRQLIVGNQGRTHQVGAYQGSFRGRERIAYQDLPSVHEIEQILEQLTANITLRTEDIPRRPITLPPIFTELSEIDVYTEKARLDLQYDDLKTDKPRTASLARLCILQSIMYWQIHRSGQPATPTVQELGTGLPYEL